MAIDANQKEIISIFYHIVNKNYTKINTDFVLDNLEQVLLSARQLGIKHSELSKYLKKDPDINKKIETYVSGLALEEFSSNQKFFNKLLDKNSPLLIEKNLYSDFTEEVYSLMDNVSFMTNIEKKDFTKILSLLDQIEPKKVDINLASSFIQDMFWKSSYEWTIKEDKLTSSMIPLYEHPNFIALSQRVFKEDKYLAKNISRNVENTLNTITQETIKNIYPQGEFGRIKPSEQVELLDFAQKIAKLHNISITKAGIATAKSFKKYCDDYSEVEGTQKVSDAKYQKVQTNLDNFLNGLKKTTKKTIKP